MEWGSGPRIHLGFKAMSLHLVQEEERKRSEQKWTGEWGSQKKDGGEERAREAGLLYLLAHSVRRKTKRRVRGSRDEIIPGNLERNFLNHRLGSRPLWQAWLCGVPQGRLLLLLPHYRWQQSAWPVMRGS